MELRRPGKALQRFNEGTDRQAYLHLGAHPARRGGRDGVMFRTWAPNAKSVAVVGDYWGWSRDACPMLPVRETGIWERFVPGDLEGSVYKYHITGPDGQAFYKADPFGFFSEAPPADATRYHKITGFRWSDGHWLNRRRDWSPQRSPLNVYQLHPGSWRRRADGSFLNFEELADELVPYITGLGYTHVGLLPLTEHLDYASGGMRTSCYYAPSARYGTPQQLMALINRLHRAGIGVLMDWVPTRFPLDEAGLGRYDGEACFEVEGTEKTGDALFDLQRPGVRSFLISSALFWLDQYHLDGLRLVGLDTIFHEMPHANGEWEGEHMDQADPVGLEFLRELRAATAAEFPDALMIGGDAPAGYGITKPAQTGGLGYDFRWYTDRSHDILWYAALDSAHKAYNHDKLTFRLMSPFGKRAMLPLPHEFVAGARGSLLGRMPGRDGERFAALRALLGFVQSHPGKTVLFMGGEMAQDTGWGPDTALDWPCLDQAAHRQFRDYVAALNSFYLKSPPLWQVEDSRDGFRWIVSDDHTQNVLVFRRLDEGERELVIVCNFSHHALTDYRFGVMGARQYRPVFSSNEERFGGSGEGPSAPLPCEAVASHGYDHSVSIPLPPLTCLWLKPVGQRRSQGG